MKQNRIRLDATLCLAGAAAIVIAACAPTAVTPQTSLDPRPTLESLADRLPASLAGFARGGLTFHERERPGFGVTAEYAGPSRSAVSTVSLYDHGQPAVPDSGATPEMQREFAAAIAEAAAMPGSSVLSERDRSEVAVPGQSPMQCARLQGAYGRQQVQTLVCLGAAAGRYLLVQVTSPARQIRPVDPMPFIVGIAQAARG